MGKVSTNQRACISSFSKFSAFLEVSFAGLSLAPTHLNCVFLRRTERGFGGFIVGQGSFVDV